MSTIICDGRQRRVSPSTDDASARSRRDADVGVAELLKDEPAIDDVGEGGGWVGEGEPPKEPPWRPRRGRPDRPPAWMRWLLYGLMLIAACVLGWLTGKMWARIDKAAWGPAPLFGEGSY